MSQPHASTDNHHAAGYYGIRLQGHLATRWANRPDVNADTDRNHGATNT